MKHEGFFTNRLTHPCSGLEKTFADEWKKENANNTFCHLIENPTQRDATVAATVIQWLGSNVGISFLQEVAKQNPDLMKRLK